MPPIIRAPSEEAVELARALIREPGAVPQATDPTLQAAVASVASEFEEFDLQLIAQVAAEPAASQKREVLELAMAQRIERARLLSA